MFDPMKAAVGGVDLTLLATAGKCVRSVVDGAAVGITQSVPSSRKRGDDVVERIALHGSIRPAGFQPACSASVAMWQRPGSLGGHESPVEATLKRPSVERSDIAAGIIP